MKSPRCPYCYENWQKFLFDKWIDGEYIEYYDCCDCSELFNTCPI